MRTDVATTQELQELERLERAIYDARKSVSLLQVERRLLLGRWRSRAYYGYGPRTVSAK